MFDTVLNTSLPGEERKVIRDVWITAIDRPVLPKATHACSDRFTLSSGSSIQYVRKILRVCIRGFEMLDSENTA